MNPLKRGKITRPPFRPWMKAQMELGIRESVAKKKYKDLKDQEVWLNERYVVLVYREIPQDMNPQGNPDIVWLSIRGQDRAPLRDWRDFQEIKNQLVGEECEALEIYPAESRKVDASNQYHLFCFTNPEVRIPFGFVERGVDDTPFMNSKQRPLKSICNHDGYISKKHPDSDDYSPWCPRCKEFIEL